MLQVIFDIFSDQIISNRWWRDSCK